MAKEIDFADSQSGFPKKTEKQENIFLSLILNIILPSLILMKSAKLLAKVNIESSPAVILCIALAFPIIYGIYDFGKRKTVNFFSILGFVSILITGGIGLFELDKEWIAVKEAAVPSLLGIAVIVSLRTPYPLIKTIFYNPQIFDVVKIEKALIERGTKTDFNNLMIQCTYMIAGSFIISALLNYLLAYIFIQSETGTDAFNEELGKMTLWSHGIIGGTGIVILLLIMWKLFNGIKRLTGLGLEEIAISYEEPKDEDKQGEPKNVSKEELDAQ